MNIYMIIIISQLITNKMDKVKLISYTKNVDDDTKTLEDLVAYCARVSNPSNQVSTQSNSKLIGYLIRNNHWSPFEMVSICLEINTTRDIARQILRHRSFSFQEFSQRYAVADLGFEVREARLQDTKNRQNSLETDNNDLEEYTERLENLGEHDYNPDCIYCMKNNITKDSTN